VAASKLWSTLI